MITHEQYSKAQKKALGYYEKAGIILTEKEKDTIEVSDFNLNDLENIGLELIVYINTEKVCAKEIVLFPYQTCPQHIHPTRNGISGKEETFRCRFGQVYLYISGETNCRPLLMGLDAHKEYFDVFHEIILHPGQQYTLEPDIWHWFRAGKEGAIVSEFSTTSTDEDDIFTDPRIVRATELSD